MTRPAAFTHVFIDPASPDGLQTGLLHPSYIQCENLFTLDKRLVVDVIGSLTTTLQRRVDDCLKSALGKKSVSDHIPQLTGERKNDLTLTHHDTDAPIRRWTSTSRY